MSTQNESNLLLDETRYPGGPFKRGDEPVLIISEAGMPLLESVGDVVMPANYSFECINNFFHCEDPSYEDLQNLALGMAGRIAELEAEKDGE